MNLTVQSHRQSFGQKYKFKNISPPLKECFNRYKDVIPANCNVLIKNNTERNLFEVIVSRINKEKFLGLFRKPAQVISNETFSYTNKLEHHSVDKIVSSLKSYT